MLQSKRFVVGAGLMAIAILLVAMSSYYWGRSPAATGTPSPSSHLEVLGNEPTQVARTTATAVAELTRLAQEEATAISAAGGTPVVARGPEGRYLSYDTDPPLAIPDNNAGGVRSTIQVGEDFVVGGVQLVNMQVDHPDTGELVVTLHAPDGTTITPVNKLCPGAQNWVALTLDDASLRPLGGECQNGLDDAFYPPAGQELAHFAGKHAKGDWTLQVVDTRSGNVGLLKNWGLQFSSAPRIRRTPTPEPTFTPEATATLPVERGPDGRYLSPDTDPPRAIPDNDPAGVRSTIRVPEDFAVVGLQLLNVKIQHPDTSELVITLQAPDGTTITPLDGVCPGAHNWTALSLDDAAPRLLGDGCQNDLDDAFRPPAGHELARFAGQRAQGTWTLQVVDKRGGNAGTLAGWSLLFTSTPRVYHTPTPQPPGSPAPPDATNTPGVERGPDGRYLSPDTSVPLPIPDNNPAGARSVIRVPENFTVVGVQLLNLKVQHTHVADLVVTLRAPDGTTITPVNKICAGTQNWAALTLDDAALRPLNGGCQNNLDDAFYPPAGQELARFRGKRARGEWTLQVVDTRGGNVGALAGWSLLFTSTPRVRVTPTPEPPGTAEPTNTPGVERGPDGRYLSPDTFPPRAIPDNDPNGARSIIRVPEAFNVVAVQLLNLQVQHANVGDLVVTLRAPDGTTITPINSICPGASNWSALTLDDIALRAVGEGCQNDLDDAFRPPPGQELARFRGKPAQGNWTLQVVDTRLGNTGTLEGWSLLFLDKIPVPTTPTPEATTTPEPTNTPGVERGPDGRYLSPDTDPPRAIPDNDPAGARSIIRVPEAFNVVAVQLLNLKVQHANVGDLVVTLRAPDGTTITPINGICAGTSNWTALTLDDIALRAVGEGCQNDLDDAFRPPAGQELAHFRGKPAQGNWTLQVVDTRSGNTGTLTGWSLLFLDTIPVPTTPTPQPPNTPEATTTPEPTNTPLVEQGPDGRYLSPDTDPPRAVPDNDANGARSVIRVPEEFIVGNVQLLNLQVQHPDMSELVVTLRAPDGTTITPINGICPGTSNWTALTLDDGAEHKVGDVCHSDLDDAFRPLDGQALATFIGKQAQGYWTLQVIDTRPGNTGTLEGWSLLFTAATPAPTPEGRAPGAPGSSPALPVGASVMIVALIGVGWKRHAHQPGSAPGGVPDGRSGS